MKKIISMLLALMLTCTLCIPVFAADDEPDKNSSSIENNTLDKDELLRLLVAQMQYQDPLDAQDNSELLPQLAQFSTLEQMSNVSSELSKLEKLIENIDSSLLIGQPSNMIGKEISWQSVTEEIDENGESIEKVTVYKGKVKEILRKVDGVISIIANDGKQNYSVNLSDVMSISEMDNSENTASILSVGYPEIVYGIGGIAVGVVATLLISRKKKVAVNSTAIDDEE